MEQIAFRLWLNDRSLLSEFPLLVVCSLFPVVLIMAVFEVLTRVKQAVLSGLRACVCGVRRCLVRAVVRLGTRSRRVVRWSVGEGDKWGEVVG